MFLSFFVSLLLSSFWTSSGLRCGPFSPPVRAFNFYRAQGSAFPLLVDSRRMLLTHALAFRESICAQEKDPANVYEYALGGTQTNAIDL